MRPPKASLIAILLPLAVMLSSMASPAADAGRAGESGVASSDGWTTFRCNTRRTGNSESRAPRAAELLWAVRLPAAGDLRPYPFGPSTGEVNDVNCASPLVLDGTVFIGSVDRHFYCIDSSDGTLRWHTYTAYRGQHAFSSSPAVAGDSVFAATGDQAGSGRLYCFDRRSGAIRWEFDIDDITYSTPAVSGNRVYIANSGDWVGGNNVHCLYCLGVDDGMGGGAGWGSDLVWSLDPGDYAYSSPALHGDRRFIGCADGRLLCVSASTGRLVWVHRRPRLFADPPRGIMGSTAVADGMVIVGTADGRITAVPEEDPDADGVIADSELLWSFDVGRMVASSPVVADGRVYIAGRGGRVFCFGESRGH